MIKFRNNTHYCCSCRISIFYQEYYKFNRVGNRKDNGNGQDQQIGSTVVEIDEVNKFNILNIELSIPINYYHKSFIFIYSSFSFPQNSATITTEDAVIKKTLRKFYWSAGVSYWFNTRKTMTRINHYLLYRY
jgi:hypothetical protein